MNKINFEKIAKQIVKENPKANIHEQAQELYISALSSPSFNKCKQLIRQARSSN